MINQRAAELLSLEGQVAIVTGGASGIGRGIARRLAEMGAAVAVLDIDEHGATQTVAHIAAEQGTAEFFKCDVTSGADCRGAVEQVIARFRRVHILCNNAGVIVRKDVTALNEQEWDRVLNVNLKSVYLLSREVLPQMIANGGGSIINTGSGWSLKAGARAASYCAAKAAVLNLTRAMAIDYGKHNIRVNCVCPGDVDTPLLASECEQLGADREVFFQEAAVRPLARLGTPEDVANAVLFLASKMSTWITGTHLVVDGGGLA